MYTLSEHVQFAPEGARNFLGYITGIMAKYGDLLSYLPFDVNKNLSMHSLAFIDNNGVLPTWTPIGTDPTQVVFKGNKAHGAMYLRRNQVEIDRVYEQDPAAIVNPLETQIKAYLEVSGRDFNDKFLNNDSVSGNTNAFEGLRGYLNKRSDYGIPAECSVNMSGLDIRSGNITAAVGNTLIRQLDDLLTVISGGNDTYQNCYLFMNYRVQNAFAQAVRLMGAGGGFDMTKDAYDRPVYSYRGARILSGGFKFPLTSVNPVLTNTESDAGTVTTGGTKTSIMALRMEDEAFYMWANNALEDSIIPIPLDTNPGYLQRVTFDQGYGTLLSQPTGIGRLYNLLAV